MAADSIDTWKIALGFAVTFGVSAAAFVKSLFDARPLRDKITLLEIKVAECEADRARMRDRIGEVTNDNRLLGDRLAVAEGSIATLTGLLRREIHIE